MTQEDKELLLRDLCGRLPYGIKGNYQNSDDELLRKVTIMYRYLEPNGMVMTGDIKPYLFPLSSMTREQLYELREMFGFEIEFSEDSIELSTFHHNCLGYLEMVSLFEWFNKNHFDYRGLISKGLAIDCTNLNIY